MFPPPNYSAVLELLKLKRNASSVMRKSTISLLSEDSERDGKAAKLISEVQGKEYLRCHPIHGKLI